MPLVTTTPGVEGLLFIRAELRWLFTIAEIVLGVMVMTPV